jgi:hypothetical protein
MTKKLENKIWTEKQYTQSRGVPITGGNEMTNSTAIGTSQPTFKLKSTMSVYSVVHPMVRGVTGPLTHAAISSLASANLQFVRGKLS